MCVVARDWLAAHVHHVYSHESAYAYMVTICHMDAVGLLEEVGLAMALGVLEPPHLVLEVPPPLPPHPS